MRTGDARRNNVTRDGSTNATTLTTTNGAGGTAVHYFEILQGDDICTAIQVSWTDAVSSAAIVVESTNFDPSEVAVDAAASYFWVTEPITVTGPAASAAGSVMIETAYISARRIRLKITVAATSKIIIRTWGKQ